MGRYRPHTPGKRSIAAGLVNQEVWVIGQIYRSYRRHRIVGVAGITWIIEVSEQHRHGAGCRVTEGLIRAWAATPVI